MRQFHAATTSLNHRKHIASILWIVCAIALTIVVLAYGRGSGPAFQNALPGIAVQQTSANPGSSVEAAVVERARHREAQARAELERRAAAEAAEKSRRALALADGANETQARKEREEMALRRAAVEEANRSAAETEGAWKRFYKPSAACSDPSAGATVGCVNEYMRAKREFAARQSGEGAR